MLAFNYAALTKPIKSQVNRFCHSVIVAKPTNERQTEKLFCLVILLSGLLLLAMLLLRHSTILSLLCVDFGVF